MYQKILHQMLPHWISAIKTYADTKRLICDDRALLEAKHQAARVLVEELSFYLPTNNPIDLEVTATNVAKQRFHKVLRELIERSTPQDQAFSPMTQLFVNRQSGYETPSSEVFCVTPCTRAINNPLRNVLNIITDQVIKIRQLREAHKNHHAGCYDQLLECIIKNINFTLMICNSFALRQNMPKTNLVFTQILTYLCMLDFDNLIYSSPLYAQKNYYSGSCFNFSPKNIAKFNKLCNDLRDTAHTMVSQDILLFETNDWVSNFDLTMHCHYAHILKLFKEYNMSPLKFIHVLEKAMHDIEKDYISPGTDGFKQDLEKFKPMFKIYTWGLLPFNSPALRFSTHEQPNKDRLALGNLFNPPRNYA